MTSSIAGKSRRDRFAADRKRLDEKAAPLKNTLAWLEGAVSGAAIKAANVSGEERAVLDTPEAKRSPLKKLAKGLDTSLRITWEEVAAAVSGQSA